MKRTFLSIVAAGTALSAQADEDLIRQGEERFKLNLGTILNDNDTTVRIDGPQRRGVEFGLEGIGGLQRDVSSVLASGTWRFAPNHRVGFQSFSVNRRTEKVIDRDLVIDDKTIPAGTALNTEMKTQFLIANYQYSFIRKEHVELSGLAGIYGARLKFNFNSTNPPTSKETNFTAPLPVVGAGLDTFINPRWTVSVFAEGLLVQYKGIKGTVQYSGLSTDYMLTKHWGAGLGYSFSGLSVEAQNGGYTGSLDWRTRSLFAYLQARF